MKRAKAWAEIVQPTGIRVGQNVLVRKGPFASFSGVVEANLPNDRVKVGVSLFGRMSPIVLDIAKSASIQYKLKDAA